MTLSIGVCLNGELERIGGIFLHWSIFYCHFFSVCWDVVFFIDSQSFGPIFSVSSSCVVKWAGWGGEEVRR